MNGKKTLRAWKLSLPVPSSTVHCALIPER
jgi:hypothetical protein